MCFCSDDHSRAHQRSAAINKAVDCGSKMLPHLPFFMDLAPSGSGSNVLPSMRKTLESYVFADYEEMIASVPNGHAGHVRNIFVQRVPEGLGEELS